jgi:hypothetical protein
MLTHGYEDIDSYLHEIDALYEGLVRHRAPEEILLD